MKRRYSYRDCYRILNIEPGCTWDELRKAYKLQIQKWHPDRFTDESAEKQAADDKIKRITSANQQLVAYYRKHGRLPEPEVENTASALPRPAPNSHYSSGTTPAQTAHTFTKKSNPSLVPILILISIISFLVWKYAPYTHAPSIENRNMAPARTDTLLKAPTTHKTISPINGTDKNAIITNSITTSGDDDETISYGSTVGAVIAIQGPPTRQIGDTWFYGESEIYFLDGKVIGWRHMPGSALKISVDQTKNNTAR